MKSRKLLEFTLDLTSPVSEISDIITEVIACYPANQYEILRALDGEIGMALAALETQAIEREAADDGASDI